MSANKTLLDSLKEMASLTPSITNARIAIFAIGEEDIAYLSQCEVPELVEILEKWCKTQRELAAEQNPEEPKAVVH